MMRDQREHKKRYVPLQGPTERRLSSGTAEKLWKISFRRVPLFSLNNSSSDAGVSFFMSECSAVICVRIMFLIASENHFWISSCFSRHQRVILMKASPQTRADSFTHFCFKDTGLRVVLLILQTPRVECLKGYLFQDATLLIENRTRRPYWCGRPLQ